MAYKIPSFGRRIQDHNVEADLQLEDKAPVSFAQSLISVYFQNEYFVFDLGVQVLL